MRFLLFATAFFLAACAGKKIDESEPIPKMIMEPGATYAITAEINDENDPIRVYGIDIPLGAAGQGNAETKVTVSSSNIEVVPNENLVLSGSGNFRNLKITPVAPGYSTIVLEVVHPGDRRVFTIDYAASLAPSLASRRWHSGSPDASAAIGLDENYMLVANDEANVFFLYHRNESGPPINIFDFNSGNILNLEDSSGGKWKEVDVEGGVQSFRDSSVSYWIGSMSNNSSFLYKPNRNLLFSVSLSGSGLNTTLAHRGAFRNLRQHLVRWGDRYGYQFSGSGAVGSDSKSPAGFNIEGITFAPDQQTLYIGFRAPLVPVSARQHAVIAPVRDFETWFFNGRVEKDLLIDAPIELNLGGRGIRDIIRLPDGSYAIMAGSSGWELQPAAYLWSGKRGDQPTLIRSFSLEKMNVEAVLPVVEKGVFRNKLQVFTDNGSEFFYCDTLCIKDLLEERFKKFSSVVFHFNEK